MSESERIEKRTHIYILLLLLRHFSLWRQLVGVDFGSFQSNVVQCVLVRNVDILLGGYECHFDLVANTRDGSELGGLCRIRSFRSPRQIVPRES